MMYMMYMAHGECLPADVRAGWCRQIFIHKYDIYIRYTLHTKK